MLCLKFSWYCPIHFGQETRQTDGQMDGWSEKLIRAKKSLCTLKIEHCGFFSSTRGFVKITYTFIIQYLIFSFIRCLTLLMKEVFVLCFPGGTLLFRSEISLHGSYINKCLITIILIDINTFRLAFCTQIMYSNREKKTVLFIWIKWLNARST